MDNFEYYFEPEPIGKEANPHDLAEIQEIDHSKRVMTEQSLAFSKSGTYFIFSDCPESPTLYKANMLYLWYASLSTTPKDFEMYHVVKRGTSDFTKLKAGIAIKNNNSTAVTITYKVAVGTRNVDPNAADADALSACSTILASFLNVGTVTKTVAANSTAFICGYEGDFVTGKAKFITIRAQLKSSKSNVSARLFISGAQALNDYASLFGYTNPIGPGSGEVRFCGTLAHTKRSASVSAASTYTYRLFAHQNVCNNTNEYESGNPYKTGSTQYLDGNYGVQYTLNISNANGKIINIEPDWTISDRQKASLTYRLNNGTWTAATTITQYMKWTIALGNNSSATFDLLLPGGNWGNFLIYFS